MAPEDIGDLSPEREESCRSEIKGGDDPVQLFDLIWIFY
jgi:hypothetical protein